MAAVKPARSGAKVPVGANRKRIYKSPIDKAKAYEVIWQQVSPLFEAARPIVNPSFVYFIGEPDDGPIKIGVSKDPVARLRGMQTGNPRRLRIEHVLLGDAHIEKLLHEIWETFAIVSSGAAKKLDAGPGTEWFTPDVRAALLPIVETAAVHQAIWLDEQDGDVVQLGDLERIIRQAHAAHEITFQAREVKLGLGVDGTLVRMSRASRI